MRRHHFKQHMFWLAVALVLGLTSPSQAEGPRSSTSNSNKLSAVPTELVEGTLPGKSKVVLHEQRRARPTEELDLWSDGKSLIRNGLRYHRLSISLRDVDNDRFVGILLDAPFFSKSELHLFEVKSKKGEATSLTFHEVGEMYVSIHRPKKGSVLTLDYHIPPSGRYREWFEPFEERTSEMPFESALVVWDPAIDRLSRHTKKGARPERYDRRWSILFTNTLDVPRRSRW